MKTDKKSRRKQPSGLLSKQYSSRLNQDLVQKKSRRGRTPYCASSHTDSSITPCAPAPLQVLHFHQHSPTEIGRELSKEVGNSIPVLLHHSPHKGEIRWGFANRWTLQIKCWCMAVNMQKISISAACYGENRVTPSTARTNV